MIENEQFLALIKEVQKELSEDNIDLAMALLNGAALLLGSPELKDIRE